MRTNERHRKVVNGLGLCSVPMWCGGLPAGFCDKPAYGTRPAGKGWRDPSTGEIHRFDGKYNGYIPGLACRSHGGPSLSEVSHKGDPCEHCGTPHDDVAPGPCPALLKEKGDGL
jgi:hypothetical protein